MRRRIALAALAGLMLSLPFVFPAEASVPRVILTEKFTATW